VTLITGASDAGRKQRVNHPLFTAVGAAYEEPCDSSSRIASMNSAAGAIFTCGRSVFFRRAGIALRIASRTNRRCTRSFRDTPWIVPTPNSYSNRICSNNSTLVFQSNSRLQTQAHAQIQSRSLLCRRWAKTNRRKWTTSECQNHLVPSI
jgi:hypothetical protein